MSTANVDLTEDWREVMDATGETDEDIFVLGLLAEIDHLRWQVSQLTRERDTARARFADQVWSPPAR